MFSRSLSVRVRMMSGVALLALGLGPAHAQEAQTQNQQDQTQGQQAQPEDQQDQTQGQQDPAQDQQGQAQGQQDEQAQGQQGQAQGQQGQQAGEADALIATVGATDVRASDVLATIEAMPPGIRQQPREMLVPMAIEQVILRELILQQATAENLADDPDVQTMVRGTTQVAEEDAMVRVWLQREMEDRITDERVQEVYGRLQAEAEQEVPPLDAIRPQIEQQLGREAIQGIGSELRDNVSVVYYGPDGQPIETTAEAETGTAPEDQEGQPGDGSQGAAAGTAETEPGQTGATDGSDTDAQN